MSNTTWTTFVKFVGVKPSKLRIWSFHPPTGLFVTDACREWVNWVASVVEIVCAALVPVQFPFSLIVSAPLKIWIQVVAVGVGVWVGELLGVGVGVEVAVAKVPVGVAVGVGVGTMEEAKADNRN